MHDDIAFAPPAETLTTDERLAELTLLAPEIVEAIMDGKQGPEVTLAQVLEPFPVEWHAQMALRR